VKEIPLSEIAVGKRHRKDMGDLDALAASIREVGLLQPVAVWPDNKLACGARRLRAAKMLGWSKIPAVILRDAADLTERLKAERDENTCRKDFAPTEALALAADIKGRLEKEAKQRQREGHKKGGETAGRGRPKQVPSDSDETNTPLPNGAPARTDDAVAESVGMGRDKYRKAEAVAAAAEAEPEKYGDLPAVMDDKSVDAAFREMRKRQAPPPPPPGQATDRRLRNQIEVA
jgi:ParB family chromosome partitioning protein